LEEKGRLKQQVATLEGKSMSERMLARKQRLALAQASTLAKSLVQQLWIAIDEGQSALSHAHEQSAQTEHLIDELSNARTRLVQAEQEICFAQQQQADASAEAAANSKEIVDLEAELAAGNACRDDLKAQLFSSLAAQSSLSGLRIMACICPTGKHLISRMNVQTV
jgi:paraquat-inducible protein B